MPLAAGPRFPPDFVVQAGPATTLPATREKTLTRFFFRPDSLVYAELKTNSVQTVTAFGQARSYMRFSHKAYLVLPQTTTDLDKERIETLCSIVGLGLVLFDAANKSKPDYEIRVRPIPREPDPAALNEILVRDEVYKKLK